MMNLIKEALQLDILRLSDNAITDQGVHHLSPLVSQVSHLDLSLNQV
jgi:Ran GTPase-activating protein (RanGAP) involved in mRNA processing and transport